MRRWYFVLRRGRVGDCQVLSALNIMTILFIDDLIKNQPASKGRFFVARIILKVLVSIMLYNHSKFIAFVIAVLFLSGCVHTSQPTAEQVKNRNLIENAKQVCGEATIEMTDSQREKIYNCIDQNAGFSDEKKKEEGSGNDVLTVLSSRCVHEHGYVHYIGEVKNKSKQKLSNIIAHVTFRTSTGEVVKTGEALLDFNPLMPSQTSPFTVLATDNPMIKRCELSFKVL